MDSPPAGEGIGAVIAIIFMAVFYGGFMLFMLFIIGNLAKESKAGRLGTFVLFFVLAFGMLGFIAKTVLTWFLE